MSSAAVVAAPTDAAARDGGGYVPVQLTAITPIRVCDVHGEYFETEIDLDAPMRVLQLAVEDYFKVKPEVQLLLHNRQQINPDLTLRGNGCLLLKGDPYVKLVLVIKRGPVLNLVCHTTGAHAESFPIAIHESSTVWDAKRALCAEFAAKRSASSELAPQQLRLLWRYMELNDRAELQYYRIPTNSVLTVRVRRGGVAGGPRVRGVSPPSAANATSPAVGSSGGGMASQGQPWARLRQQRGGPAPLPTAPYDVRVHVPPPPLPMPLQPQSQPPQPQPQPQQVAVPPPAAHEEVRALRQTVQALQGELAMLREEVRLQESRQRSGVGAATELSQWSAQFTAAASHRIQELEETVNRFQAFLQRALSLIP